MDPRLTALLARLESNRFADLAGSELYSVVRIGDAALNEAAATLVASSNIVRSAVLHCRAGNQIDVQLKLVKPAMLPAFNVTLQIEEQPQLPDRPDLVLRLTGAGGLLRLAAPAVASSGALPPGVRLDGDRVRVNLRELAEQQGQAAWLEYLDQLQLLSEEGRLVVAAQFKVR